jgi:hypothetical protein
LFTIRAFGMAFAEPVERVLENPFPISFNKKCLFTFGALKK